MKYRFAAVLLAVALVSIVWQVVRAQSRTAVIPFAEGITIHAAAESGVTGFARRADGTYVNLQVGVIQPFPFLNSIVALTQLLSDGLKKLAASPVGPAGVGLQSQAIQLADLDGNGSIGAVYAKGSVANIYQGTTGLSFRMLTTYPIGPDVNSAFFADFNGDGKPDLAVAYDGFGNTGGVAVLLNKGDGRFGDPVTYAKGIGATRFAVFDLNHDGFLDIATAELDQKITVLLGKGDGTFRSPVQYSVGGSRQAIAIADVNGDGHPDIVAGGDVGILLGNGDGTFRAGSPLPSAASTTYFWAFAAGDLNGDKKIDLVCADIQNQFVLVLFGKGDGTFQTGPAYAVNKQPNSLILADYDHDGRLDIISGTGDAGAFGPGENSGYLDILLNKGDGTFRGVDTYFTVPTSQSSSFGNTFSTITGMATAKFGGASQGVLASGSDGGVTLFLGDGKGGLQPPQSVPMQGLARAGIVAADFNGDGKPDAAVGQGNNGNIAVFLGSADGLGSPVVFGAGGVDPAAIVSGDFDGDGKLDLAAVGVASGAGALAILKGNGDGTFRDAVVIPAGVTPLSMSATDINGDGKLDLIFADSGTNGKGGAVYVAMNNGTGGFQAPVSVFPGLYPAFGIADVNGDGKLDLVACSGVPGTGHAIVNWLRGNGNGTFGTPVAIADSDATDNAVLVQDFDGDGHADIVLAHQDADLTFMAGNGDGTFSEEMHLISTGQPALLQAVDLNGDGKPDLIAGGNTISVLLNKSAVGAKATVVSAANPAAAAIAPGSLATAYGTDLAKGLPGATTLPLPTIFGGTTVSILDSFGASSLAPLLYVSPTQVNFEVPAGVATGLAQITVTSSDGTQSVADVQIAPVAPGVFQLNSGGLAAAYVILYHANGSQTFEKVYTGGGGVIVASPVSLGSSTDQPYLFLFGTGLAAAGKAGVTVSIGGVDVPVKFAGSQGGFAGLDQVNLLLPASLAGRGNMPIQLKANGIAANTVNITIR